jgi:single-stranded-DNA-specific exonuclease
LFSTPANEPARGSARSVEGLNITAAIAAQKDLLLNFGGHPMAAGLSLEQEKLPEFRRRLAKTVEKKMGEVEAEPTLQIDGWLDLPEVTLELAENLEQLAPFGPGNEKLTLATRGLTLQSTATIGRNKEHLKLNIRDETGNAQTVLWWDGAGEPLPEGKFDLAYTIRASDWRGTRQVQMEFVDFRIVEKKPVEVKKPPIEILDYRNAKNPHKLLLSLPAGTLVWAEGEEKKRVGGVDRNGLINAEVLAIWTTPPGPEELHAALETVKPKTIYLFATASGTDEPKAFLERLTGLVKYAINKRAGRTSYAGLAAATAQRETTVRFGLEWLATSGHVVIEVGGDTLRLAIDSQAANQYAQQELITALKDLLEETVAYRAHFSRADCESILQTRSIE